MEKENKEEVKEEEEEELPMLRRRRQVEEEEEEDEDEGDFISCPPGTLYCIAMDSCVRRCDEAYEELEQEEEEGEADEEEGWEVCAPGEFYCMGEGRCSRECGRQAASLWDDDDDEEEDDDWEVCLPGQVFCMEVMACVSDCGFFGNDQPLEEDDGEVAEEEMGGGDIGEFSGDNDRFSWLENEFSLAGGTFCPEGTVYCMMSAKCQEPSQPCKSKAQVESRDRCPLGERSLEAGSPLIGFSTCQISSHCPPDHSCCPFTGGEMTIVMMLVMTMPILCRRRGWQVLVRLPLPPPQLHS